MRRSLRQVTPELGVTVEAKGPTSCRQSRLLFAALGCCGLLNLLYFLLVPRAGIRFQSDQLQCNIHSAHRATMETRQIAIDEAMSASHRSFERGV